MRHVIFELHNKSFCSFGGGDASFFGKHFHVQLQNAISLEGNGANIRSDWRHVYRTSKITQGECPYERQLVCYGISHETAASRYRKNRKGSMEVAKS
jgi:hypothetical protein